MIGWNSGESSGQRGRRVGADLRRELSGPFTFEAPTIDGGSVELHYRIGADVAFTERVEFPFDLPDTAAVARAVRVLHFVAGVSYYKCIAPAVLVMPGLTGAERRLVTALYDEGLREFSYRNGFAVPLPVEIVTPLDDLADGPDLEDPPVVAWHGEGALVPIGGGKDSALVAALVPDGQLFAVNPVGAHVHLAKALGRPLLAVRRTLDPLLRELVAEGAPNGHVPVTAITSAIAVLTAVAVGRRDVLMGIERSADEPSLVTSDGIAVNHQFSKSWAAEQMLRDVFAPIGVQYLSLLRPLTELAIGAAVARRGLAGEIVSCNRVFTVWNENTSSKQQRPCGECAKCLFTALMIAPSTTPLAIATQYGRALLDEPDHVALVRELWSDEKPFDCVGERLETAAALVLLGRTDGWRDQAVVTALVGEAQALLDAAGVVAESFLEVGPVELLPMEYRGVVAALAPDLAAVVHATR